MQMGISWGDGEEEQEAREEVSRNGEGKVGEMGSWGELESYGAAKLL